MGSHKGTKGTKGETGIPTSWKVGAAWAMVRPRRRRDGGWWWSPLAERDNGLVVIRIRQRGRKQYGYEAARAIAKGWAREINNQGLKDFVKAK
jgi:hypothetical protein